MVLTKSKIRRPAKRLYHGAKISDYHFKKVLGHFVLDHTAAETARRTGLSANSVTALFGKLRVFFTQAGLFSDPYEMGMCEDNEEFEYHFLGFHIARIQEKRGIQFPQTGPDYHMAESHWRFHFHMLRKQRPSEAVHAMMLADLLELIRICGPVGVKPVKRKEGLLAVMRQMDRRLLWLERNAPDFRLPYQRAELREILEIRPSFS